jgi:hypothetical protein
MIKDSVGRLSVRKHVLVVAVAALAPLACGVAVSSASAVGPSGDFAVFNECPRFTSGVGLCLYSQVVSGEISLDGRSISVVNPVTLQGGIIRDHEVEPETEAFVGALDGETLSHTPQPIAAGLLGVLYCQETGGKGFLERLHRKICEVAVKSGLTALNATLELAAPASSIVVSTRNQISEEGVGLSLPVKVHLENPILGGDCYIGSDTDPIVFNLTTGTTSPPPPNQPISGKIAEVQAQDEFELLDINGSTFVDNAFAVPAANDCGGHLAFLLDPLIDATLGLPAPSGTNTVIQHTDAKEATSKAVIASEQPTPPAEKPSHTHEPWEHAGEEWNHAPGPRHRRR